MEISTCEKEKKTHTCLSTDYSLTLWNILIGIEVFVDIHCVVHHVGVTQQIQLALEDLVFIIYLQR